MATQSAPDAISLISIPRMYEQIDEEKITTVPKLLQGRT